jgi:hypothetical protein
MKGVQSGNGKGWLPFEFGIDSIYGTPFMGPIPRSDVIAWYKMNEGTGVHFFDSTVHANVATLTGADGSWTSNVFTFNGTGPAQSLNVGPSFNGSQPFTMSCWISTTTANQTAAIYSQITTDGEFEGTEILILNGLPTLTIQSSLDFSATSEGTTAVPTNGALHSVIVTYDGSGSTAGMKIYLDNVVGQTSTSNNLALPVTVSTQAYIGARFSDSIPWIGAIKDIRVFNVVLDALQINYIFSKGPQ